MNKHRHSCYLGPLALVLTIVLGQNLTARSLPHGEAIVPTSPQSSLVGPICCAANHNVGQLVLAISNCGVFGTGFLIDLRDSYSGTYTASAEFPKGSEVFYLFGGAIWVGAVVGTDTLVSVGADGWRSDRELHPDVSPIGDLVYRSTLSSDSAIRAGAISEQDFIAVYTDTFTSGVSGLRNDAIDNRPHIPLHLEVTQKSYAWSVPSAEDMVIFDYRISNIGQNALQEIYVGIFVDGDVSQNYLQGGYTDDLAGFAALSALGEGCPPPDDSIPVAWIIDNDGDPQAYAPCRAVTGIALLKRPPEATDVSFNWWVSSMDPQNDYGPSLEQNFRDFQTGGMGTPEGDRNKYFLMQNGERDPNQCYTANVRQIDSAWLAPANQQIADSIARGVDTKYLLSFGPFSLDPGEEAPFTFAYVAGEAVHHVSNNLANLPANPDAYMANLDFSDFFLNVRLAHELYDNPFVDTDGDGNYGQTVVCWGNEMWVTGDGVPDFRPRGTGPNCCLTFRGNVNGSLDDRADVADLSYLIAYLTGRFGVVALACPDEANIDGRGIIDLTDLALLVSYLTLPPATMELPECP